MKYIIFTGTITRVGGAQMYVSNKSDYLKSLGWEVFVFSGLEGPVLIKGLEEYQDTIYPELDNYPNIVGKHYTKAIIKKILTKLAIDPDAEEKILIESNTLHVSCWAELLAKEINAKHLMFLLDENFPHVDEYFDYIKFKFERGEIAVIKDEYIEKLLKHTISIDSPDKYKLIAYCNNVVEDIADERFDTIEYSSFDYTLCSLGRLNKKYIPTVVEEFIEFAQQNPQKKICYIFIGDQPKDYVPDMYNVIKEKFSEIQNVTIFLMGYVYPIPKSFFKNIDVAVASAGSSRVLCNNNVVTVSMDASDGQPIGVLGYTTHNTLNRSDENIYKLSALLDEIINHHYLEKYTFQPFPEIDVSKVFADHIDYINNSATEKQYFDINKIKLRNKKDMKKSVIIKTVGVKNYKKMKRLISR